MSLTKQYDEKLVLNIIVLLLWLLCSEKWNIVEKLFFCNLIKNVNVYVYSISIQHKGNISIHLFNFDGYDLRYIAI